MTSFARARARLVGGGDDLRQRVPAVSGAAGHQQDDPALVRRQPGGVDDLRAVLSARAARRLCLCPLAHSLRPPAPARHDHAVAAGARVCTLPITPDRILEAAGRQPPGAADPAVARRQGRRAVLLALDDRPARAGLVRPRLSGHLAVSLVRSVERRLAAGAAHVSVSVRAAPGCATRKADLVARFIVFAAVAGLLGWRVSRASDLQPSSRPSVEAEPARTAKAGEIRARTPADDEPVQRRPDVRLARAARAGLDAASWRRRITCARTSRSSRSCGSSR